ncbi:hypothetical protein [Ammoniphilus sp. 3BR4]|uniref:hypothetical protein n=1 Tax=Ammoniphilus sp. 3BR4 TaxID=3158265 RepID=UPI003465477B
MVGIVIIAITVMLSIIAMPIVIIAMPSIIAMPIVIIVMPIVIIAIIAIRVQVIINSCNRNCGLLRRSSGPCINKYLLCRGSSLHHDEIGQIGST